MSAAFLEEVEAMLVPLGPIRRARFFGGHALTCSGAQFAMLMKGALYLRTDAALAGEMAAFGSRPFSYATRRGEVTVPAYHTVPEAWLEDPDKLLSWARRALASARASSRR